VRSLPLSEAKTRVYYRSPPARVVDRDYMKNVEQKLEMLGGSRKSRLAMVVLLFE
jgi:hypothetical protein